MDFFGGWGPVNVQYQFLAAEEIQSRLGLGVVVLQPIGQCFGSIGEYEWRMAISEVLAELFSWGKGDLGSEACHGQETVSQQKKTCDSAQFSRCIADSEEPR